MAQRIRVSLLGQFVPEDEGTTIFETSITTYPMKQCYNPEQTHSPHSDNPASHPDNVSHEQT